MKVTDKNIVQSNTSINNLELLEELLKSEDITTESLRQSSIFLGDIELLQKSPEMALALIGKGIDVNIDVYINGIYEPLLAYVIRTKQQEIIEALLRREDLDVNVMVVSKKKECYSPDMYTPLLIYTIEQGDFDTAQKLLLKPNLDILKQRKNGDRSSQNILQVALNAGNIKLLESVLSHKAITANVRRNFLFP